MENRLISMTDKVIEKLHSMKHTTLEEDIYEIQSYAIFLKLPLKLEYFVTCDEDGNVLEEKEWKQFEGKIEDYSIELEKHKKAHEKVLFEGFYIDEENNICVNTDDGLVFFSQEEINGTIEGLIQWNLTLTPSAIKQYNL